MTGVSRSSPCEICHGDHKCSRGHLGLIVCGRPPAIVPEGYLDLGPARGDEQFNLYRRDDGATPARRSPTSPKNWPMMAVNFALLFVGERIKALASALKLPVAAMEGISEIGWSDKVFKDKSADGNNVFEPAWMFPERDGTGAVCGILKRFEDGSKKRIRGSTNGLSLAVGWREATSPLLIVEGPSDVLALAHAGVAAVGRPSNTGGVAALATLLRGVHNSRPLIVVGENDLKPTGLWPGRDGAKKVSTQLSQLLGRPVPWAMPPEGDKDARSYLTARCTTEDPPEVWKKASTQFLAALESAAVPTDGRLRPFILIGTDQHRVNEEAETALANDPELFVRGSELVTVTRARNAGTELLNGFSPAKIQPLPRPALPERLTRLIDWERMKTNPKGVTMQVPAHPPEWCVAALSARGFWHKLRKLEVITDYPIILASGEVVATPGYHAPTGIYYAPPRQLDLTLKPNPNLADAMAAKTSLFEVVGDFPFANPAHRSAWLAALLTMPARAAIGAHPAPLFFVDANTRGSGKGLLVDAISLIIRGERVVPMAYTHDEAEFRKRVTSIVRDGTTMVCLDNVVRDFGVPSLDVVLTAASWKDRLLGNNTNYEGPLITTWYATGNNPQIQSDTLTRVLPISLETDEEKPEEREGFAHPNLRGWILGERSRLLSCVMTILQAFLKAENRPKVKAWGRYEEWSSIIRSCLVWLGEPDPIDARAALAKCEDPKILALKFLYAHWHELDPQKRGLTCRELIEQVSRSGREELAVAVQELAPEMKPKEIGYVFRPFRKTTLNGRQIDHAGQSGGAIRWKVTDVSVGSRDRRGDGGDEGDDSASPGKLSSSFSDE